MSDDQDVVAVAAPAPKFSRYRSVRRAANAHAQPSAPTTSHGSSALRSASASGRGTRSRSASRNAAAAADDRNDRDGDSKPPPFSSSFSPFSSTSPSPSTDTFDDVFADNNALPDIPALPPLPAFVPRSAAARPQPTSNPEQQQQQQEEEDDHVDDAAPAALSPPGDNREPKDSTASTIKRSMSRYRRARPRHPPPALALPGAGVTSPSAMSPAAVASPGAWGQKSSRPGTGHADPPADRDAAGGAVLPGGAIDPRHFSRTNPFRPPSPVRSSSPVSLAASTIPEAEEMAAARAQAARALGGEIDEDEDEGDDKRTPGAMADGGAAGAWWDNVNANANVNANVNAHAPAAVDSQETGLFPPYRPAHAQETGLFPPYRSQPPPPPPPAPPADGQGELFPPFKPEGGLFPPPKPEENSGLFPLPRPDDSGLFPPPKSEPPRKAHHEKLLHESLDQMRENQAKIATVTRSTTQRLRSREHRDRGDRGDRIGGGGGGGITRLLKKDRPPSPDTPAPAPVPAPLPAPIDRSNPTDAPKSAVNAGERRVQVSYNHANVELTFKPSTKARQLQTAALRLLAFTNAANGDHNPRDLMLVEDCAWLGLKRPLRPYERVRDVANSWASDSENSLAVVRPDGSTAAAGVDRDAAAVLLDSRAAPSKQPREASFVAYHCSKPGKWAKRTVTLRPDGQVVLSAREKGPGAVVGALAPVVGVGGGNRDRDKDGDKVCHMSDYDVHAVTPEAAVTSVRPPKHHVCAVKSMQKAAMFLATDRYVHYFCSNDPDEIAALYRALQAWRSWYLVHVLDEAADESPDDLSSSRNSVQSGDGRRPLSLTSPKGKSDENRTSVYQLGSFKPLFDPNTGPLISAATEANSTSTPSSSSPPHGSAPSKRRSLLALARGRTIRRDHNRDSAGSIGSTGSHHGHLVGGAYTALGAGADLTGGPGTGATVLPPGADAPFAESGLLGKTYAERQAKLKTREREREWALAERERAFTGGLVDKENGRQDRGLDEYRRRHDYNPHNPRHHHHHHHHHPRSRGRQMSSPPPSASASASAHDDDDTGTDTGSMSSAPRMRSRSRSRSRHRHGHAHQQRRQYYDEYPPMPSYPSHSQRRQQSRRRHHNPRSPHENQYDPRTFARQQQQQQQQQHGQNHTSAVPRTHPSQSQRTPRSPSRSRSRWRAADANPNGNGNAVPLHRTRTTAERPKPPVAMITAATNNNPFFNEADEQSGDGSGSGDAFVPDGLVARSMSRRGRSRTRTRAWTAGTGDESSKAHGQGSGYGYGHGHGGGGYVPGRPMVDLREEPVFAGGSLLGGL